MSAKPKTDSKSKSSSQLQKGETKSKSKSPPVRKNETESNSPEVQNCETESKSSHVEDGETEPKSTPVKKKKTKSKSKSPSVRKSETKSKSSPVRKRETKSKSKSPSVQNSETESTSSPFKKKGTKSKSPLVQNSETESTSSQVQNSETKSEPLHERTGAKKKTPQPQPSCSKSKSKSSKSKAQLRKNTGVYCDELLAKLKDLSLLKPAHDSDFLEEHETISFENLEKFARVGEYIEIHPCKIYTPHRFYFRFRKSNWRFMRLNYVLQDFYKWNQHVPFVTNINEVTPERMFIVQHKLHLRPKWFRVKVIRVVNEKEILVWFVDYGVSDKVLLENLKYLHREFAAFPRQAILGSLANIKPKNREWTESANGMFRNLALNKDLVAGVVWVDTKFFCVWMALSCTVGTEVHINDALVEKGHARFDDCVTSPAETEEKDNSTKSSVFYYSDISSNNHRLKDMFSQGTSKSC